jgi:hypothetical protein
MTLQNSSSLPESLHQPALRKYILLRLAELGYRIIRGSVRRLWRALSSSARMARNLAHRLLKRSDYKRWTDLGNYEVWWDERTQKIAQLIPEGSRVIEFGAGRRQLEKLLDSSCSYISADLTSRGPDTILCDLNQRPLPDLRSLMASTAVFGGVLEYILDLDSLVKWLSDQFVCCIASYTDVIPVPSEAERVRQKLNRLYYGYMNNYTEEELVSLFEKYGFACVKRDTWTNQRLFLFSLRGPVGRVLTTS